MGNKNGMYAKLDAEVAELRRAGLYLESDGQEGYWRCGVYRNDDEWGVPVHEGYGATRAKAQKAALRAWREDVKEITL